jgi:FtsP/CotA-like multicopper oxidase with cupredoxin domain
VSRTIVVALLVLLALGGLFFALRPDAPSSGRSDADREGGPRTETFDVSIEGGAMTPGEISVSEGDRVTLRLTSDEPVELHLHGYDLEKEVNPGETATLSFEADLTGRFEVEDHDKETALGVLLVRPR